MNLVRKVQQFGLPITLPIIGNVNNNLITTENKKN